MLLRGVGLAQLWPEGLILSFFAVAPVGFSVNRFHQTVD